MASFRSLAKLTTLMLIITPLPLMGTYGNWRGPPPQRTTVSPIPPSVPLQILTQSCPPSPIHPHISGADSQENVVRETALTAQQGSAMTSTAPTNPIPGGGETQLAGSHGETFPVMAVYEWDGHGQGRIIQTWPKTTHSVSLSSSTEDPNPRAAEDARESRRRCPCCGTRLTDITVSPALSKCSDPMSTPGRLELIDAEICESILYESSRLERQSAEF